MPMTNKLISNIKSIVHDAASKMEKAYANKKLASKEKLLNSMYSENDVAAIKENITNQQATYKSRQQQARIDRNTARMNAKNSSLGSSSPIITPNKSQATNNQTNKKTTSGFIGGINMNSSMEYAKENPYKAAGIAVGAYAAGSYVTRIMGGSFNPVVNGKGEDDIMGIPFI